MVVLYLNHAYGSILVKDIVYVHISGGVLYCVRLLGVLIA